MSVISLDEYQRKKDKLCAELLAAKNVRLGKATSNLFRHRTHADRLIDVSHFNNVIAINSGDKAARLYFERCGYLEKNPPPEDWGGVWVMESK